MTSKRRTQFIGIGSQKGGVGKSTITTLLASYLYFNQKYELAVLDCDYPQHSISALRVRDKQELDKDPEKMQKAVEHFKSFGKTAYKIIDTKVEDALTKATQLAKEQNSLDFILFDLPGSINIKGVFELSFELDYIFSPLLPDMQSIQSALTYAQLIHDRGVLLDSTPLKSLHFFWNQVDGREKTQLIDIYTHFFEEEGIEVLKSFLPKKVRFNKEACHNDSAVFRSTYFPPDKRLLKDSHIEELAYEIMNIVNKD